LNDFERLTRLTNERTADDGIIPVAEISAEHIKWDTVVMPSEGESTTILYYFREMKQILADGP
jgi:hypothetical protein